MVQRLKWGFSTVIVLCLVYLRLCQACCGAASLICASSVFRLSVFVIHVKLNKYFFSEISCLIDAFLYRKLHSSTSPACHFSGIFFNLCIAPYLQLDFFSIFAFLHTSSLSFLGIFFNLCIPPYLPAVVFQGFFFFNLCIPLCLQPVVFFQGCFFFSIFAFLCISNLSFFTDFLTFAFLVMIFSSIGFSFFLFPLT